MYCIFDEYDEKGLSLLYYALLRCDRAEADRLIESGSKIECLSLSSVSSASMISRTSTTPTNLEISESSEKLFMDFVFHIFAEPERREERLSFLDYLVNDLHFLTTSIWPMKIALSFTGALSQEVRHKLDSLGFAHTSHPSVQSAEHFRKSVADIAARLET